MLRGTSGWFWKVIMRERHVFWLLKHLFLQPAAGSAIIPVKPVAIERSWIRRLVFVRLSDTWAIFLSLILPRSGRQPVMPPENVLLLSVPVLLA